MDCPERNTRKGDAARCQIWKPLPPSRRWKPATGHPKCRHTRTLPRTWEFPSYVCVVKATRWSVSPLGGKFLYRNLTIRQETDKGIESYAAPFIYTKTGIELYEPLTINGVTAQKLDLKEEYYFANEDDSFIISGPKPVTSDNILTYGAVETTFNTVKVTVTPSNSDTYYVAAFLPSEIAGYTDKQLRNAICDLLAAGDLYSGEKTLTFNYLYDQAEYILVGFGIDATTMAQRPRYSARA